MLLLKKKINIPLINPTIKLSPILLFNIWFGDHFAKFVLDYIISDWKNFFEHIYSLHLIWYTKCLVQLQEEKNIGYFAIFLLSEFIEIVMP